MKTYTREQIAEAVETYVDSLSREDLSEIVCQDMFEFYRKSALPEELEEFMADAYEGLNND
jgi:ATP-dependent helicase/DNAse subunit B